MHLLLIAPIRRDSCRTPWRASPFAASSTCTLWVLRNSWIGSLGFLQVGQHARLRGTGFAAGRGEALRDAVIAQRAFVGRVRFRIEEAAAVRAGLDAVAAAEAVFLIHQHDAVGSHERRAHRADLHARRVGAVVAELGDEEGLGRVVVLLGESVVAAVG